MFKTLLPNVQWAQRSDRVYLTIDLQDTADSKPEISLSNDAEGKHGHLSFKGKGQSHATGSDAHNYALELDLYGPINVEESKVRVTGRGIVLVIQKQEKSGQHSQGQRLHAHVPATGLSHVLCMGPLISGWQAQSSYFPCSYLPIVTADEHWPRLLKESGKLPRNIKVGLLAWLPLR